jgi:hypothetical protein
LSCCLPTSLEKPDAEMGFGELLHEGTRAALIAGRDICRGYDPDADLKERRLVSETAGWIARLGVRVAEGEFRARRDDTVGRLLEQLRAAERA